MNVDVESLTVERNEEKRRFEIALEDQVALADYRLREAADGTREIVFPHTEVPRAYEGQGIGSKLVGEALDYAREQELRVVPACPFVAAYIRRHPAYQELVSQA